MLQHIAPWLPPPDGAASARSVNKTSLLLPAPLAPPGCMARGGVPGARQCRTVRRPGRPPHQHSCASPTHSTWGMAGAAGVPGPSFATPAPIR